VPVTDPIPAASETPAHFSPDKSLISLLGLEKADLQAALAELGLPKFRAGQIWRWVFRHGLSDFNEMTDLAKPLRPLLASHFHADRPLVSRRQQSVDGTIKWLVRQPMGKRLRLSIFQTGIAAPYVFPARWAAR